MRACRLNATSLRILDYLERAVRVWLEIYACTSLKRKSKILSEWSWPEIAVEQRELNIAVMAVPFAGEEKFVKVPKMPYHRIQYTLNPHGGLKCTADELRYSVKSRIILWVQNALLLNNIEKL